MIIQWNHRGINKLNNKIEDIASRDISNSQKTSDIISEAKKIGIELDKRELRKIIDNGNYPHFDF